MVMIRVRLMLDAFGIVHVANEVGDALRARCLSRINTTFTGIATPARQVTCLWCVSGNGTWR